MRRGALRLAQLLPGEHRRVPPVEFRRIGLAQHDACDRGERDRDPDLSQSEPPQVLGRAREAPRRAYHDGDERKPPPPGKHAGRRRTGVSVNHVDLRLGPHHARLDYLLVHLDDPAHAPLARVVALLKGTLSDE